MKEALYHRYDPVTQRATEIETDPEAGLVIWHTQGVRDIVEACKREAASFDPHVKRPDGFTKVASIPLVVWRQLQKLGITNDEAALNKWLNERDNRVFRTDDGRKL